MIASDITPPRNAIETEQRSITRVVVLSPHGLGDKRYSRISKHLAEYSPKLPRRNRIHFTNKNYFDYSNSIYKNWIWDDRSLFTRLKLRFNLARNKQDFGALYDKYFREGNIPKLTRPGMLACTIAHIAAWQSIRDTDDLCLILEDDAALLPGIDATSFSWPKDAHLLHLIPSAIRIPLEFDGDFALLPRTPTGPSYAFSSAAYVISYEGAKLCLNKMVPCPVASYTDGYLFCRQCEGLRVYATRSPLASVLDGPSLLDSNRGSQRLAKSLLTGLRNRLGPSKLGSSLWRITPKFVKRFIGRLIA